MVNRTLSFFAACLLGIFNQFEIISLAFYRPKFLDASGVDRLHSVFGNPGWFAEYILVCSPFVLLLLGRKTGLKVQLLMLIAALVFIGMSLLLTGSRTSWLFFPLAMFFCYTVLLLFHRAENGQTITWQGSMAQLYAGWVGRNSALSDWRGRFFGGRPDRFFSSR